MIVKKLQVAKSDMRTHEKRSKRIYTVKYTPIETIVAVNGREICKMRFEAGWKNQSTFAEACGWSPTRQSQFEANGRVEMTLTQISKMIRVCNGRE